MKKYLVTLVAFCALQPAASFAAEADAAPGEETVPAFTQRLKGLYVSMDAGWAMLRDTSRSVMVRTPELKGLEVEPSWDNDDSLALRAAVGYADPHGKVRSEFEVAWQKNEGTWFVNWPAEVLLANMKDMRTEAAGTHTFLTFMLNMYYDFKNRTGFTPFLGVGAGYGKYTMKTDPQTTSGHYYDLSGVERTGSSSGGGVSRDTSKWHFAVQALGGLSYALTDHISIEVKYAYFVPNETDHSHNVYGGLRYTF